MRQLALMCTLAVVYLIALGAAFPVWALDSVTITETTRLSFGTVAIPASGTQYLVLNPANSVETGTGTLLFGAPSRGAYTLKSSGSGSSSITIDIMDITTNSPYLTLNAFTGIYNGGAIASFPSSPLSLPLASGTILYLGAQETATAGMTPGSPNPTFNIVVTIN